MEFFSSLWWVFLGLSLTTTIALVMASAYGLSRIFIGIFDSVFGAGPDLDDMIQGLVIGLFSWSVIRPVAIGLTVVSIISLIV